MKHKPALYALERLHAELGGKLRENEKEAARLVADMMCVERVLKMLEPEFDVSKIAPRRKNNAIVPFKKGAGFKLIAAVLRRSPEPLTSRQIVEAILREAGDPEPAMETVRGMVPTIHSSLLRHSGTSVERVGEGSPARWRLVV
jgi:hypothetical protein